MLISIQHPKISAAYFLPIKLDDNSQKLYPRFPHVNINSAPKDLSSIFLSRIDVEKQLNTQPMIGVINVAKPGEIKPIKVHTNWLRKYFTTHNLLFHSL
jgi:hypothetical protein